MRLPGLTTNSRLASGIAAHAREFYRLMRAEKTITMRTMSPDMTTTATTTIAPLAAQPRSRAARALLPRPGIGQVRLRVDVVDQRARTVAATIDAVGADAVGFAAGDRVAYLLPADGADPAPAHLHIVDVDGLVGIPHGVSLRQAAAHLVPGMSARTLVKGLSTVGRGHTVVVLGASGAVGSMAASWARALGAIVIDSSAASGHSGRIDAVLDARDTARLASRWTGGHLALGAADVFQAVREGVFGDANDDASIVGKREGVATAAA
jgi:hypothetical protein